MKNRYAKCQKFPAYHLLTDERKQFIDKWETKRDRYLKRSKQIRLILLGESMPASRYFYDLETEYEDGGLRYSLKKEFGKLDLEDNLFLMSMARKGIVLFDCALCPLHIFRKKDLPLININKLRRYAATYCFQTITGQEIVKYSDVPIVTIFPSNMGWLKNEIPFSVRNQVVGEYIFSDQTGLSALFEEIKKHQNNQNN